MPMFSGHIPGWCWEFNSCCNSNIFPKENFPSLHDFSITFTKTSTEPKTVTLDVLEPFLAFASATCHLPFQVLLRKNYRNLDPLLATSILFLKPNSASFFRGNFLSKFGHGFSTHCGEVPFNERLEIYQIPTCGSKFMHEIISLNRGHWVMTHSGGSQIMQT